MILCANHRCLQHCAVTLSVYIDYERLKTSKSNICTETVYHVIIPANAKRSLNVDLMLVHRFRSQRSINPCAARHILYIAVSNIPKIKCTSWDDINFGNLSFVKQCIPQIIMSIFFKFVRILKQFGQPIGAAGESPCPDFQTPINVGVFHVP